jgi:hypothetical protein
MRLDLRRGLELHGVTIDRLPINLKGALAAACTQRQGEVYRAYAKSTNDGSAKGFDDLLDKIWNEITSPQASEQQHKSWEDCAETLYPDQKTKSHRFKGGAELAILSLLYSNGVLMTGKTQDTIDAAHQMFGSIEHFLTSPLCQTPQFKAYQPDTYAKVLAHPLTEAEHRRQERDLIELEQAIFQPAMIPVVVDRLRNRAKIEAKIFLPLTEGPIA